MSLTTGSDYKRSHDLTGLPGIVTLPCVYPENNHRSICLDLMGDLNALPWRMKEEKAVVLFEVFGQVICS